MIGVVLPACRRSLIGPGSGTNQCPVSVPGPPPRGSGTGTGSSRCLCSHLASGRSCKLSAAESPGSMRVGGGGGGGGGVKERIIRTFREGAKWEGEGTSLYVHQ